MTACCVKNLTSRALEPANAKFTPFLMSWSLVRFCKAGKNGNPYASATIKMAIIYSEWYIKNVPTLFFILIL
jgi:hypothetical protein